MNNNKIPLHIHLTFISGSKHLSTPFALWKRMREILDSKPFRKKEQTVHQLVNFILKNQLKIQTEEDSKCFPAFPLFPPQPNSIKQNYK